MAQGSQSILNPSSGESKDSNELASRYKSKLQSQSGAKQNAPSFGNELLRSAQTNAPASRGGYGMGMGGGMGMGMGGEMGEGSDAPSRMGGMQGGMGGPGTGSGGMGMYGNNFGVTPAFGAPDGSSEMREFRQNRSLVVTAPQETHQATEEPYMNSLAIALPARGKEFFFTTPRGDAVLSVNGVSKSITQMFIGLVIFVLGVVVFIRTR